MRIASLLPSATEIVCALGGRADLVAVSHECDYPAGVRDLPRITASAVLTSGMSQKQIDASVSAVVRAGGSTYDIDHALLRRLDPDLLITQALCDVCAVSEGLVHRTVHEQELGCGVLTLTPLTLDMVWESILQVGQAIDREVQARDTVELLRTRTKSMRQSTENGPHPRVLTLEWFDPPFIGGHWLPEQVELAGGVNALGAPGEKSRRATWDEIAAVDPDLIVLLPCGYDLDAVVAQSAALRDRPEWGSLRAVRDGAVWAVDANGWFSRPGPRLVEGIEALAQIFADPLATSASPGTYRLGA